MLRDKIEAKSKEFIEKVHNAEVSTIWKIKDCEDLLKKRVSE